MKKTVYVFGHEILMDDLMINTAQLASYLEVTKGALHTSKRARKNQAPELIKNFGRSPT